MCERFCAFIFRSSDKLIWDNWHWFYWGQNNSCQCSVWCVGIISKWWVVILQYNDLLSLSKGFFFSIEEINMSFQSCPLLILPPFVLLQSHFSVWFPDAHACPDLCWLVNKHTLYLKSGSQRAEITKLNLHKVTKHL